MHDNLHYERPFLKEVIARIDFLQPIAALKDSLEPSLEKIAKKKFPIIEPLQGVAQELRLSRGELRHEEKPFKQWNFFGTDREKQLSLASHFAFVTFSKYKSYEDLQENWNAVIEGIAKVSPEARAARFGLRYINNIEIEGVGLKGWNRYIAPELIQSSAFFGNENELTRLFNVAELKFGNLDLRFHFGIPNPDFPAVIRRPVFVLDFDAYVQHDHELSESLRHMDAAHDKIQGLFERSITGKLREQMRA